MTRLPWRSLVLWALLGTAVSVGFVLNDLQATGSVLGTLVDTSPEDPAAAVLGPELGPDAVRPGGRHDGAYFYVIARDPFSPTTTAASLDGPRYRLQRITYPVAAWLLHPGGGGPGLMWALFVVGVLSVFGGAVAMGALSVSWRGPPWVAVLFPLQYGSIVSLRISVPDPMTLALALGALVLYVRHCRPPAAAALTTRPWWRDPWYLAAIALAVAATLARESTWLVFLGFWAADRSRRGLPLLLAPAAAAGAWALFLRVSVPAGEHANNITLPFADLGHAISLWGSIDEPMAYLNIFLAVIVGLYALWLRRLRHPLSYVVLIQLAFLTVLTVNVLVPARSAPRQVMPLLVAAVLMVVTPKARLAEADPGEGRARGGSVART